MTTKSDLFSRISLRCIWDFLEGKNPSILVARNRVFWTVSPLLFLFYDGENFCEKYSDAGDDHKEDDFPVGREEYSRESKDRCKKINHCAYLRFREPDLHEAKMKV